MLQPDSWVIHLRLSVGFHAPQPHAYPAVEAAVRVAAVRPGHGEVIRRASDNAV